MSRIQLLIALVLSVGFSSMLLAADDPKPAADAPKADPSKPAARKPEQVEADLQAVGNELRTLVGGLDNLLDEAKRKAMAPKAIPAVKKAIALFDEFGAVEPRAKEQLQDLKREHEILLVVLGDADTKAAMEKAAEAKDENGLQAKVGLKTAQWWTSNKDAAVQGKLLDEMEKLAKENPKSDLIADTLMKFSQLGAANNDIANRSQEIISTNLTSDMAKEMAEQIKGQRKQRDAVGKAIELKGTTVDGKAFTSADWKGKVVLVDFWATWCGPCIQSLPKLKKAYAELHPKGLEVVGISCDSDPAALKKFLEGDKEITWTQLYDAKENPKLEWHPLAKDWGISGIPTVFLIDRKGNLRKVGHPNEVEGEIAKLVEEKE